MHTVLHKRQHLGLTLAIAMLLALALVGGAGARPALAQAGPTDGMVCTSDASPNPTFSLTTQTGYVGTPDGNVIYMWGFSAGGGAFQHPSPVLCVNEGDTVTIIVVNTLPQAISIMFPGQENVLADGAPAQPQFDGGGVLTSLTNVAPANGGSVTYSFVATHPGTFVYQSGTNPAVQVRMGLFGALVVRPAAGQYFFYNDASHSAGQNSEFNHAASGEIMILQSEIDPALNQAVERGQTFNLNNYHPRYWMINGRGFPDTVAPNFAGWLPSQPYGALAHVEVNDDMMNPLWYGERYLNVSSVPLPFHPHGKNAVVIGQDGQPLRGAGGQDLSYERFSLDAGPGQTFDALFHYHDAEGYNAANPVPVTDPGWQNLVPGMYYSGSPYLGTMGPMPPGMSTMNECGEYYIIAHNHALFQLTSWGVPMTGPGTFMRVDPPGGCTPMP